VGVIERWGSLLRSKTRIFAVPDDGLVTLQSSHDFAATLERLTAALESKGVRVFAQIDHAAGAASAGLELRPTTLVVFGNPVAGTPLMQAVQTAGIDLPLKALVWQDAHGAVHLTYNDPVWIAARHGLDGGAAQAVSAMAAGLAAFARHATEP
jgi:uncharacterized protein (DUF302 family)